jgi:tRNA dimethylallyltransferase
LEKKITKEQCIQNWTLHELQYAKRQLTWFKKNPKIQWFDALDYELKKKVENAVQSWYDRLYATH